MLAALQRNKWYAAQGFAVVAIGYAIPIYLLLLWRVACAKNAVAWSSSGWKANDDDQH
jgi:hypothetical protein